jgi:hypothetical protein
MLASTSGGSGVGTPASKYAGCNGACGAAAGVSLGFLRRFMRSRIHLRMFRLLTYPCACEQCIGTNRASGDYFPYNLLYGDS